GGQRRGRRVKQAPPSLPDARRDVLIRWARRALLGRLLDAGTATADDVVALIGPTPDGIDPRFLGTVPGPLARAGIIRRVGFGPSARPTRHAGILSRWELADRAAALAWLARHPTLPAPENEDDGEGALCPAPLPPPPSNLTASQLLLS